MTCEFLSIKINSCIQLPTSAVNATLLAFAAAAPQLLIYCKRVTLCRNHNSMIASCLCWCCQWQRQRLLAFAAAAPCSNRSISPARRAHSSKPAAAACDGRMQGQTDVGPLHRPCSAYYTSSVNNNWQYETRFTVNMWHCAEIITVW